MDRKPRRASSQRRRGKETPNTGDRNNSERRGGRGRQKNRTNDRETLTNSRGRKPSRNNRNRSGSNQEYRGNSRKIIPTPARSDVDRNDQNQDDLIFGRHAVIAAIEHERPLNKIWVVPQVRRNNKVLELLNQAKTRGAVIDETTQLRLDQLTQYAIHQGIVAQVGACQYLELDELLKQARQKTETPVLIAVDGITDPHNLGAIIRSAEAMGVQGLILPQRRAASVGATVAKVAAGALESLPISRVINLNQALETLKEENFWVYGLTLDAAQEIQAIDLSGSIVLLIGSEGKGLSANTQKHCDGTVKIPLAGETQSLNASVAAGIGIYEIFRQRRK